MRLPFLCSVGLHAWVRPDRWGWLRYCDRCEKVEEDCEAQMLAMVDGMLNKQSYMERIAPEHLPVLTRYTEEQTLWQRTKASA